jgi:hypothetical protein
MRNDPDLLRRAGVAVVLGLLRWILPAEKRFRRTGRPRDNMTWPGKKCLGKCSSQMLEHVIRSRPSTRARTRHGRIVP